MRLFIAAAAFTLACAASATAQSGRVKRSEPAPQPTPEAQAGRRDDQQQQADSTDDAAELERDKAGNRVYTGRQVDQRARVLSRPEPIYPRRARRNNVEGRVVLRVLLGASGEVEKVTVVRGLPDGLTEEAVRAAHRIKFLPAERDGRKVSQWVTVVYHFNVY